MADDRQTKLDTTMSSVTPARLEATRQEVEIERQKLSSPKPEVPTEEVVPGEESPPPSSGTTERMQKLDLIQDMQLILVDKYRRGTTIMMGAVAMMALSLLGLTGLIAKNYELHDSLQAMQEAQQKLIERGAQIEKKTDETKQKVTQAVDEAPKIEIGEDGQARVVLPFRKHRHHPTPSPEPSDSEPAPSTPPSVPEPPPPPPPPNPKHTAPLPANIPIETKGF